MADSEGSAPGVNIERIENIEDADLQVNRYTVENGEVVEEEVDASVSGDDIQKIADEVGEEINSAMEDFEMDVSLDATGLDTGEAGGSSTPASTETTEAGDTTDETDTTDGTDDEVEQAIKQTDTGGVDDPDDVDVDEITTEQAKEISQEIIESNGLTVSNWSKFAAAWRDRGVTDQSFMGDMWAQMKKEDVIGEAQSVDIDGDGSDDTDDTAEADTTDDTDDTDDADDDGGSDTASGDVGTIDYGDSTTAEIFDHADQAHLAIRPAHDASDEAIDQFEPLIESGDLNVLNIRTNLDGKEIMSDAGIDSDDVPAVLLQYGDSYYNLAALVEGEQSVDATPDDEDGDDQAGGESEAAESEGDDAQTPDVMGLYDDLPGVETGDDILLLGDGQESAVLGQELGGEIADGEVLGLPGDSDVANMLREEMGKDLETPAYIRATNSGLAELTPDDLMDKFDIEDE